MLGKNAERLEPPTLLRRMQNGAVAWKTVWQFLKSLNRELLYNPGIPFLGYSQKKQTLIVQFIHRRYFTIAPNWKQPKCPSVD